MTKEKEFRKHLLEHYQRNNKRIKKEKEKDPKGIICEIDTEEQIKEMINIDIENWKEAIKNKEWGFRTCRGARCFLK